MSTAVAGPAFDEMELSLGKRVRLRRLLNAAHGTPLLLDAGCLERGPRAGAPDTRAALSVAQEHDVAVLLQIGAAERLFRPVAGVVGLVLRLNGKTDIPPDDEALAPLNATVEDAVQLGADAVCYTLYAGSPAQFEDLTQLSQVRQDCRRFGMPLIVQAAPRGAAIERKGGPRSQYALEYAARAASEAGADLVLLAAPRANAQRDGQQPKPYNTLQLDPSAALQAVIGAAAGAPVLVALDDADGHDAAATLAEAALDSGAVGVYVDAALIEGAGGTVRLGPLRQRLQAEVRG